jgi:hypothetical protein
LAAQKENNWRRQGRQDTDMDSPSDTDVKNDCDKRTSSFDFCTVFYTCCLIFVLLSDRFIGEKKPVTFAYQGYFGIYSN